MEISRVVRRKGRKVPGVLLVRTRRVVGGLVGDSGVAEPVHSTEGERGGVEQW